MSDFLDTLRQNAESPASASTPAGSVTQHPLSEQINYHRYASSASAVRKNTRGLILRPLRPFREWEGE